MKGIITFCTIVILSFGVTMNALADNDCHIESGKASILLNTDSKRIIVCNEDNVVIYHEYSGIGKDPTIYDYIYLKKGQTVFLHRYTAFWGTFLQTYFDGTYYQVDVMDHDNKNVIKNMSNEGEYSSEYSYYRVKSLKSTDSESTLSAERITSKHGITSFKVRFVIRTQKFGIKLNYVVNGTNYYTDPDIRWSYDETTTYPLGAGVSNPTSLAKPGYAFKGWNVGQENWAYDPQTVSQADFTNTDCWVEDIGNRDKTHNVYAQWNAISYNITFDSDGGSTVSPTEAQKHYNIETGSPALPQPTRPGYIFKGWKLKSNSGNWNTSTDTGVFNKIAEKNGKYGDIALIAVWEENTYWLKGQVNGTATNNSQTNIKYLANSTAEMVFTPAKNYMLSGVKVTVDLDGAVTTPVNETFSPLKDSYTYPVSQVKGNTTVSVSTSRVSADVTIKRTGLQGNDSSIIKVTKQGESIALYTVILNATAPQVTLDQVPLGTYTITETNWAYSYNKTSSSQNITIASTDSDDKTVTFTGDKKSMSIYIAEKHN